MTFKENFRQGLVVGIDLQNQTVLLEDGEVSVVAANPTLSWLQEPPGAAAACGRSLGWSQGWRVIDGPHMVLAGSQVPHKQRPGPSSHRNVVADFFF